MRRAGTLALVAGLVALLAAAPASAAPPVGPGSAQGLVEAASRSWFVAEWRAYAARFVRPEGRVVDNGNGGVSHSEGQGYGMLLAARAGDADRFSAIWDWTRTNLLVRADGLAAWKWDPGTRKVADPNNATDGDILIAWALAEGAARFGRPDYRQAAAGLAQAVGKGTVAMAGVGPVLLPGVAGFGAVERPDGPVVNLSYWVFPALPTLKALAPGTDWDGVRRSGLQLLAQSRFGRFGLPADWESLAGPRPRPAAGFPPGFGYNAVRVPLYLAMEGSPEALRALRPFAGPWARTLPVAQLLEAKDAPVTVPIRQAGYNLVPALARCAVGGEAPPPEALKTRSDLYYPETLRLLSALAIQERSPACL